MPCYASGGLWLSGSIDDLQKQAMRFVSRGFRAMKTRVGPREPERMVARVRAIREAVGPDIALMVDANQQMSVKQAIRIGRMMEELNLTWFEEPVICHDHAGEAQIAAALDTPIASGETVYTHRGVLAMLQARAADVVMPDLQRMGGPTEFLKAGHLCEAFNVPCASHLFPEMSLALLAALPGGYYLEHMPWFEKIYRERDRAGFQRRRRGAGPAGVGFQLRSGGNCPPSGAIPTQVWLRHRSQAAQGSAPLASPGLPGYRGRPAPLVSRPRITAMMLKQRSRS